MRVERIKYTDYNGNEREEDFYFNFTKAELSEMEMSKNGGMQAYLKKIVQTQDQEQIVKYFKDIILKSYGEKSNDGRYFIKNEELRNKFACTEAYSELFMKLSTDEKAAADFINGVIPEEAKVNAGLNSSSLPEIALN